MLDRIRNRGFFAKKSLSQNFLVNRHVVERIVESCDLKKNDVVVEIGPGRGAITWLIAQRVKKLIVIEKDERWIKELEEVKQRDQKDNITIIHGDILRYPLEKISENFKVIGNLPYHIATPIVERIIELKSQCHDAYMMLQWEHGQRLMAQPHNKDYGSLTCFVQYYTQPKMLFKIPNTAFSPQPKVQSCFLHLQLLKEPLSKANDEELLFKIIRQAFDQRRKMIQNSLSPLIPQDKLLPLLKECQINSQVRAENLKLEDYVRIANSVTNSNLGTSD